MTIIFLGDVHGEIHRYQSVLSDISNKDSEALTLQVGDMGVGFPQKHLPKMNAHHGFIRGNHDNPSVAREHPNHIGDFGYSPYLDLFILGGGFSIDQNMRMQGVDWWEDEQLSYSELSKAIDLYKKTKPSIMVSHEAPTEYKFDLIPEHSIKYGTVSKTENALQQMLDTHTPDHWIFGHYHKFYRNTINVSGKKDATAECICLGEFIRDDYNNLFFSLDVNTNQHTWDNIVFVKS